MTSEDISKERIKSLVVEKVKGYIVSQGLLEGGYELYNSTPRFIQEDNKSSHWVVVISAEKDGKYIDLILSVSEDLNTISHSFE